MDIFSWQTLRVGLLGTCMLGLTSCGGDSVEERFGEDGNLSVWITDAPVEDIDGVIITITGVTIEPAEGDPIEVVFDRPKEVDLLDVIKETDRRERLIDDYSLPLGSYKALRLVLDDTRLFLDSNGQRHSLVLPEEEQDGLRLDFNVEVDSDTDLDLTIDFDVRKSLRKIDDTNFELHPSLRVVLTERTGTLEGVVREDLISHPSCDERFDADQGNAVYIFGGNGAVFQDLQGNAGDPLATGIVERNISTDAFEFVIGFLPQGNYTAVFTCDAEIDNPELEDKLLFFSDAVDVEVKASEVSDIVFDSPASF